LAPEQLILQADKNQNHQASSVFPSFKSTYILSSIVFAQPKLCSTSTLFCLIIALLISILSFALGFSKS
jgi:hypothetical protein